VMAGDDLASLVDAVLAADVDGRCPRGNYGSMAKGGAPHEAIGPQVSNLHGLSLPVGTDKTWGRIDRTHLPHKARIVRQDLASVGQPLVRSTDWRPRPYGAGHGAHRPPIWQNKGFDHGWQASAIACSPAVSTARLTKQWLQHTLTFNQRVETRS